MAITIKDIAKLAGVSRGTVDRVLNKRGQVAKDVEERVIKIANDLGYKKNLIASRLAKGNEVHIAVIIPNPEIDVFWEAPFKGIHKMDNAISDYGLEVKFLFFDLFDACDYSRAFQEAIEMRPDGVLVAPVFLHESIPFFRMCHQNNIPIVCINSEVDDDNILSFVGQNSYQSGRIAASLFDRNSTDKCEIVVITLGHNTDNATHIRQKINGLKEYDFTGCNRIKVFDYVLNDFNDKDMVSDFARDIFCRHQNIKGLFFSNSRAYHFLNCPFILESQKLDFMIIGFDLIPPNIDLMLQGKIEYILNQNPVKQGYFGMVNLFNFFVHNKEIPLKQYLPIDIVIKENYKPYLRQIDFML